MTRKTLAIAVLAAALGAITVFAQAPGGGQGGFGPGGQGRGGRGPGGPGGPGGPNIMMMVRQLDLSEAQQEQLKAIAGDRRVDGNPGAAAREAERQLNEAIFGESVDATKIDVAKSALATAHAAELAHRIETLQKVSQILTPVQRQQLLKLEPGRGRRGH